MSKLNLTPDEINQLFPIVGVRFYSQSLVLVRSSKLEEMDIPHTRKRGKVSHLSKRSLNNLVLIVSNCRVKFQSLLTLSYGQNYPIDGRRVKADLNKFITYLKRSFGRFEYFWFLEFQRRGAPHFHIGLTLPEPSDCERDLVATIWAGIIERGNWPYTAIEPPYRKSDARFGMLTRDVVFRQHRRVKVWEKEKKRNGMVRYVIKYATKLYQKSVPAVYSNVGRFWGVSSGVRLPDGALYSTTEEEIRHLMASYGRNLGNMAVLPKIIFLPDSLTKEIETLELSQIGTSNLTT